MKIIKTVAALRTAINELKSQQKTIGFVPTMGALHQGHLSLIRCSETENNATVVSIFVNPTQFNNPDDLQKYPRTLETDLEKMSENVVDIVFLPSEQEIYPEKDTRTFKLGGLDNVMEGKFRPGHFNGVAQVVSKLFEMVTPDRAYFGRKDFQQLAVIKHLTKHYQWPVQIVGCPIVRESDGLAMSSRNMRLTAEQRRSAPKISQTLFEAQKKWPKTSAGNLKQWIKNEINRDKNLTVEYIEIVNSETLQSVDKPTANQNITACIAVFAGSVRLIDNVIFQQKK